MDQAPFSAFARLARFPRFGGSGPELGLWSNRPCSDGRTLFIQDASNAFDVSYAAAILIVIGSAAVTIAAALAVDRLLSLEARRRHHEVGSQVFQLIGIMFSVILAFVFSEVWGEYNTAKQAVTAECSALHTAALLADSLPVRAGRPVSEKIRFYAQTVLGTEWQMMTRQQRSLSAADTLESALKTAAQLPRRESDDLDNRSQIVSLLSDAIAQRETRTFQLTLGLPAAMWAVLILIALILISFVVLSGTEEPGTIIFAGSFTTSIVMVLVLVRMLDYPFQGALAIGNDSFVTLNTQLASLLADGR